MQQAKEYRSIEMIIFWRIRHTQKDDLLINILKGSQVYIPHKIMTIKGEKKRNKKLNTFSRK